MNMSRLCFFCGKCPFEKRAFQIFVISFFCRIRQGNDTRLLETIADSTSLRFEESFYPAKSDVGLFHAVRLSFTLI